MKDGFSFEVWVIDHGHIDNHVEHVGDATTTEEVNALVAEAIKDYPIFTSDEIVIHTVQSPADNMEPSHMFDDTHEGMPEGDPIVSENMPEGKPFVGYRVTIEREIMPMVTATTTIDLNSDFLYAMYKRNRMDEDMRAKGFKSIRIEKGV